jgi:putative peptidoglycan lipid II flippase
MLRESPERLDHAIAARHLAFGSTIITAVFTAASIVATYGVQAVMAARFGAAAEMDAFFASAAVPALLSNVLVEALQVAFVPVFVEQRSLGKIDAAWRLARAVLTVILVSLVLVSALGILGSPPLIRAIAPGFDTSRRQVSITMSRILFPSALFLSLAGFCNGLRYAQKAFLMPALTPVIGACTNFILLVLLSGPLGILGCAWASLGASAAQFVFAAPILARVPRARASFGDPAVREVGRLVGWRVLGESLQKATPVFERYIASTLAVGSIAVLGYGSRIVTLVQGLMVQSVATVALPFLSERGASEDRVAFGRAVSLGMRMTALVAVPGAVLSMTLAKPLVRVLFERGRFNDESSHALATVLIAYIGVWVSGSLAGTVIPALYALKQVPLVAKVSILCAAVYLLCASALPALFGYLGLAMAISINALLCTGIFAGLLFTRCGVPWDPAVGRFYRRCIPSSVAAGVVAYLVHSTLAPFVGIGVGSRLVAVLIAGVGGLCTYALILLALRTEEVGVLAVLVRRRFGAERSL